MKTIDPGYKILTPITGGELQLIELAGRTCYKSEDKITDDSAKKFVKMLIDRGHEAMLEHSFLSVRFICDRGISHELVRTRYCNYSKDKFDNELTFIRPFFFEEGSDKYRDWEIAMRHAEEAYMHLINKLGASPQEARSVLPNSIKTEVVMTANYREWRHFLKLRTAKTAHPQMQQITIPLMRELTDRIPVIFDDIYDDWINAQGDITRKS